MRCHRVGMSERKLPARQTRGGYTWSRWLPGVALLAALGWPGSGAFANQPTPRVIPPGREAQVSAFVSAASASCCAGRDFDIVVDKSSLRVDVSELLGTPAHIQISDSGASATSANDIVLACDPSPCSAVASQRAAALVAALARQRPAFADRVWQAPPVEPPRQRPVTDEAAIPMLLAIAAWALQRLWHNRHQMLRATWQLRAVGLLAFAVAAWFWPAHGVLHDHNSFAGRTGCASLPACEGDPRGAAWSVPALVGYGLFFRLIPYHLHTVVGLNLALTVLTLALAMSVLERLATLAGSSRTGRMAAALLPWLAIQHPVWLRLAVSESMWPYMLLLLVAAAWAALDARLNPGLWGWPVALCLLVFAATANLAGLGLLALVVVAPWCWRPTGMMRLQRAQWVVLLATAAAMVRVMKPVFLELPRLLHVAGGQSPVALVLRSATRQLFADPSITPAGLGILALLAVIPIWRAGRWSVPLVLAFLLVEGPLANQVSLDVGYPTRFLHGHASLLFSLLAAAVGAGWLVCRLPERIPALWRGVAIWLAIWPTWLWAAEGRQLLHLRTARSEEADLLDDWLPKLPFHNVLLVAPDILPRLDPSCQDSDPVEVMFPVGEYAAAQARLSRLYRDPVPIDRLDLNSPQQSKTLVYVGGSLQAFLQCEIRRGVVPASLEQPMLQELRRRFLFQPVLTADVATAQDPRVAMRMAADRKSKMTIGFYWLVRKPGP